MMNRYNVRILHLIERQFPRGAELFACFLSGALAARGFHTFLCSLYESNYQNFPIPKEVEGISIGAKQSSVFYKVGFQPSIVLNLVKIIRQINPSIIIAHGADTLRYTALASRFFPKLLTIYKNIGMPSYWASNPKKVWINRTLLKCFDIVVSVSELAREDFLGLYGLSPKKVFFIPNAVDSEAYQYLESDMERIQMRERLGFKKNDCVLICVGSLSPEKNQTELLALTSDLKEMSPHLVLVGDGPMRHELEKEADELQIRHCVHFMGYQSNVIPFLAASDIFLLSSKSEGMPAVLIEAGMAGLPSVAYDVGGVREVVEHGVTGAIISPFHYEEFKVAVESLIRDSTKRKQLGIMARQQYPKRFSRKRVTDDYEKVLLHLLEKRPRR